MRSKPVEAGTPNVLDSVTLWRPSFGFSDSLSWGKLSIDRAGSGLLASAPMFLPASMLLTVRVVVVD
jgi:hypothetical protein